MASASYYLASFYRTQLPGHSLLWAFTQPKVALAAAATLFSLLYFLAFGCISCIAREMSEEPVKPVYQPAVATATAQAAPAAATSSGKGKSKAAAEGDWDADVVIMGAGTAGAALATALARQGKRVVVIERDMNMHDRIVGELMQPGGIRALERMGLAACAKGTDTRCVSVDGYVCVTPGTGPEKDLILTYPAKDPRKLPEYLGMLGTDERKVKTTADGSASSATAAGTDATQTDEQPRGRSFHNHLFVHQLRLAALAEPNVRLCLGTVSDLVTATEAAADATTGAGPSARGSVARDPAPAFRGFNAQNEQRKHDGASLAAAGYRLQQGEGETTGAVLASRGEAEAAAGWAAACSKARPASPADDRVVGLRWTDETGAPRITKAPLTIVADGMWSRLRKQLQESPVIDTSSFCGLLLHHPEHQPPLPYPNRGHVILCSPNPVLLYQISPTETRVLVDVPGKLPSKQGLTAYFREKVAPQLPAASRAAFLDAVATQDAVCMQNKRTAALPTKRAGALLLGDAWNMRHPLTGGGMTVALRDVEALVEALRCLELRGCSPAALDHAAAWFQSVRANHASTINILANALHMVFTCPPSDSPNSTRSSLRAACIDYMGMGGAYAAGPIGLLSGLTPKPAVLVGHFFAVALHAMKLAMLPVPTPGRLRKGYDLLRVACVIMMPLLESERVPVLSSAPVLGLSNAIFRWRALASN